MKHYTYNVYQIEGEGRNLFAKIEGNEDTIMGLPVKKIRITWVLYDEKIFRNR